MTPAERNELNMAIADSPPSLRSELRRLQAIEAAAINMCNSKGRQNSEIAMRMLMEACTGKPEKVANAS